jgi:pimeloyl-ACP methyl ester carboxylesterase
MLRRMGARTRRFLRRSGLIAVGIALVTASAACSGSSSKSAVPGSQPSASTTTSPRIVYAPSLSRFKIDGRNVVLVCKGHGRVPVVFQAGGTDPGTVWNHLIAKLGPDVLSCVFDRPGVAPSASAGGSTTPRAVAKVLDEVLDQAKLGPRVVLVGHSIGGADAMEFGADYPDRVAGAVLFDPTTPSAIVDPFGRAEFARLGFAPDASAAQLRALAHWPSVPLVVLGHDPVKAMHDHTFSADLQRAWSNEQRSYARLSARGVYATVPNAGHYVYRDNPGRALAAIRGALARALTG